jgi:hypothetical protein
MKITIEAEPKELAALALELQKQQGTETLNISIASDSWEKTMQSYVEKLNLRNPNLMP